MQITVKEAKVVKTGTNKRGDWELIRVTSGDNTEYTTFDKKAKVPSGSVIEFEEINEEGKLSFKECTVITEAVKGENGGQMNKEDWVEKQRIERASIENQVRAKLIVELRIAGAFDDEHSIYKKCLRWLDKLEETLGEGIGLSWQETQASIKPSKVSAKATAEEPVASAVKRAELDDNKLPEPSPGAMEKIAEAVEKGFIDMDWLKESLKTLQEKGIKAYSNPTILTYLNAITRGKYKSISEAVTHLDKAQATDFVKRVQDTLDMA